MIEVRYLVIGGGLTADSAVKALRRADPQASVMLVSDEHDAPYRRPPLSKGLWKGDDLERTELRTAQAGAQLLLGARAEKLNTITQTVTLGNGQEVRYERLLLATGARARTLPTLPASGRVIYYRTLSDYRAVRRLAQPNSHVVVVGGGFIGSEMAAALTLTGVTVTLLFPEHEIGGGRFPTSLAQQVMKDYAQRGVKVLAGRTVAETSTAGAKVKLVLDNGLLLVADLVLAGAGTVANDELARSAGLLTQDGIVVNDLLRAQNDAGVVDAVFAAGDVASFSWPAIGRAMRIEHEDNAYSMGTAAGRLMAAAELGSAGPPPRAYGHLPFFYSDLFENGYEAVGVLDASMTIVEDWREEGREGVAYYLEQGRVRGVLLWNTWGQVDAARGLIMSSQEFTPDELMGRLPEDD